MQIVELFTLYFVICIVFCLIENITKNKDEIRKTLIKVTLISTN
jgi:hypothetical protein